MYVKKTIVGRTNVKCKFCGKSFYPFIKTRPIGKYPQAAIQFLTVTKGLSKIYICLKCFKQFKKEVNVLKT